MVPILKAGQKVPSNSLLSYTVLPGGIHFTKLFAILSGIFFFINKKQQFVARLSFKEVLLSIYMLSNVSPQRANFKDIQSLLF